MKPVGCERSSTILAQHRTWLVAVLVVTFSAASLAQLPARVAVQRAAEAGPPELVFPAAFPDLLLESHALPLPSYPEAWPDLVPAAVNLPTLRVSRQIKKFDGRHDLDKIGSRGMGEGLNFFSRDYEMKMGRNYAKEIDADSHLLQDPVVNEYVNRITQNIVSHSDAKMPFTIKVIDDSEINAFCLPGGFLYVNTGLIEQADSEAALAGVIAHEVGHVAARHGARNQSRGLLMVAAAIAASAALHGHETAQNVALNVGKVAVPLTVLHFSREFEEEADLLALQYMYAAGYDPAAYVGFFEAMERKKKSSKNFFVKLFSFHPPTSDRMVRCQRLLDAYFPDKSDYALTSSEFDDVKAHLSELLGTKTKVDEQLPTLQRRTRPPIDKPSPPEQSEVK